MEGERINLKNYFRQAKKFVFNYKTLILILAILAVLVYLYFIFYTYALKVESPIELNVKEVSLDGVLYQRVTGNIGQREKNMVQEENRMYPDPFK